MMNSIFFKTSRWMMLLVLFALFSAPKLSYAACDFSAGVIELVTTSASVCSGATIEIEHKNGSDFMNRKWQMNDGSGWVDIPGETGETLEIEVEVTTDFRVSVQEDCEDSNDIVETNELTITIISPISDPQASVSSVYCGQSVILSTDYQGDAISYSWDGPGTISSPEAAITSVTLPNEVGTYTYTNTASCGDESVSETVVVEVISIIPEIEIGDDSYTFSCGSSVTLGTSESVGAIFEWTANPVSQQGSILNPTSEITDVRPTENTTYTLTAYGCGGYSVSDIVEITVNPLDEVTAIFNGTVDCGDELILEGNDGNVVNLPEFYLYEDFDDDDCDGNPECHGWEISGGVNPSFKIGPALEHNNTTTTVHMFCSEAPPVEEGEEEEDAPQINTACDEINGNHQNAYLTSPLLFTSNGSEVTLNFEYRAAKPELLYILLGYAYNMAPAAPGKINFTIQWSNDGDNWIDIETFGNISSTACTPKTSTFTPPIGEDVYLRFHVHSYARSLYSINNIEIIQAENLTTYTWSDGGTNSTIISGGNTLTPTVSPSVIPTTYTLSTQRPNGCIEIDEVVINVETENPGTLPSTMEICEGDGLVLSSEGATINTGQWQESTDSGDTWTDISGATTNPYTLSGTQLSIGTISYRYLSGDCYASNEMIVTINPNSTVPIFDQLIAVCVGTSFTLPTTSQNGVTGSWSPNVNTQETTTYTFTPDSDQCADISTMTVEIISINDDVTVNENTLTALETDATYQWIDCETDQAIPGATDISFTPYQSGLYSVEITKNGCTERSSCYSISVSALAKDLYVERINVYPNPFDTEITVQGENIVGETYSVYDVLGNIVAQGDITQSLFSIPMKNISKGIYILKIGDYSGKFLKE